MKRLFVTCHNPTSHGAISWEGHEVIGYVDITSDCRNPPLPLLPSGKIDPDDKHCVAARKKEKPHVFTGTYYQGWDAIPPELNGTMDVVLSAYCPIAAPMSQSTLNGFKLVEKQFGPKKSVSGRAEYDMVVRGFALVKPGGQMVFPTLGVEEVKKDSASVPSPLPPIILTAKSREDLEYRLPPPASGDRNSIPNTVTTMTSAAFRPTPYYPRNVAMAADDKLPWLIITKPATGGGRRRRTRRTRRKRTTRKR